MHNHLQVVNAVQCHEGGSPSHALRTSKGLMQIRRVLTNV